MSSSSLLFFSFFIPFSHFARFVRSLHFLALLIRLGRGAVVSPFPTFSSFFSIYDIREQEEEKNSGVYDFSLFFVGLKNIFLSFFVEYKEKKYEGTLFWRKYTSNINVRHIF
jgi:hypothetical protein